MDPIGIGSLHATAVHAHGMTGIAHHGRVGWHVGDHHAVGANLRAVADRDRPQHLRARAAGHVVLHRRGTLTPGKARAPERYTLVEGHVIADVRCLPNPPAE